MSEKCLICEKTLDEFPHGYKQIGTYISYSDGKDAGFFHNGCMIKLSNTDKEKASAIIEWGKDWCWKLAEKEAK